MRALASTSTLYYLYHATGAKVNNTIGVFGGLRPILRRRSTLEGASSSDDYPDGLQEDPQIEEQRIVLDIVEVIFCVQVHGAI